MVIWYDLMVFGVVLVVCDLEGCDWNWLKWLLYVDIFGCFDVLGLVCNLLIDFDEFIVLLGFVLVDCLVFIG